QGHIAACPGVDRVLMLEAPEGYGADGGFAEERREPVVPAVVCGHHLCCRTRPVARRADLGVLRQHPDDVDGLTMANRVGHKMLVLAEPEVRRLRLGEECEFRSLPYVVPVDERPEAHVT